MDLEVAGFFQHLLALKRAGEPVDNLSGFIEAGALQILALKQTHRELCERTEALREATSEAKTQLDQSSLQLQNLLYEQQHYEKEIAGCRAYTSAYTDEQLELVSEDAFRAAKPELSVGDPHDLMLNRLSHELASREETVRQLERVKAQRDALAADVAQKRSALGALEGEVAKLRSAAQKAAQQFGVPAPGLSEAGRMAAMLPLPLYVLHSQLAAAAAALPSDCRVAVELGVEGAAGGEGTAAVEVLKAMHRSASAAPPGGLQAAAAGTGGEGSSEAFPLALRLALRKKPVNAGAAPSLALAFHVLPSLQRVAVESLSASSVTREQHHALLAGLFPGDKEAEVAAAAGQQAPGRLYRWAQHAAGLDLLPPLPPGLYTVASEQAEGLAAAAAALEQYQAERRAAAVLERLIEAVLQPKKKEEKAEAVAA